MKLPIGIQSFEEIRQGGYYYVDKTPFVKKLVDEGKYYFLSRPRRFGKSLFLDTLACAFEGKRELFEGTYLQDRWDWDKKYPVIRFDFSQQKVKSAEELEEFLLFKINENAQRYNVKIEAKRYYTAFSELIEKVSKSNKAVVLIDEYDKPILDHIEDTQKAKEIREELKGFYQILKPADPYLKFVFLTGVSKFSKVSLFSGLNNLQDITLHPEYNEICGYTQSELEKTFADRISELLKQKINILEEIRFWYNGYRWGGSETLYNPFDILLFLSEKKFRAFWFETGTPEFLIKLILERKYYVPEIDNLKVGEQLIESFDVDDIEIETLLFQTGYLTIKEVKEVLPGRREYLLTYPNFEVKLALNDYILSALAKNKVKKTQNQSKLVELIERNDLDGLKELFHQFFASIPYDWYRKNQLAGYEGYYASVFYSYFTSSGFDTRAEDTTSCGKVDLTVLYKNRVYVFEFKVRQRKRKGDKQTLMQIKQKRYWEKYTADEVYIIGVEFDPKKRNISFFKWEKLK